MALCEGKTINSIKYKLVYITSNEPQVLYLILLSNSAKIEQNIFLKSLKKSKSPK
jgi:hypothetical protein